MLNYFCDAPSSLKLTLLKKLTLKKGKQIFSSVPIIEVNEPSACISNCTLFESHCSGIITKVVDLLHTAGLGKTIHCPLTFYKCTGNLVKLNKLVSGYYDGQKLDDGESVPKPDGMNKCSHGIKVLKIY